MPKKTSGFTLIEILIVLVILGALAALALPSYFNAVEEARSNEARVNLQTIYAAEKVYLLNTGAYWSSAANPVPPATLNAASPGGLNTDIATQFYNISFPDVATATAFRARATRNNAQGGNGTRAYEITQNGIVNQTAN